MVLPSAQADLILSLRGSEALFLSFVMNSEFLKEMSLALTRLMAAPQRSHLDQAGT